MLGPDLHLHSTASDGTLAPAEIVRAAASLGLPAIAITDHDTVAGVAPALVAAEGLPLTVIPAIELSSSVGERDVHILGYYVDYRHPALLTRLTELRQVRLERAERIVHALAADGIHVSLDDILGLPEEGAIGRAHIAELLVASGHVASVPEAFRTMLGSTAPYYVPKPVSSPEEVIALVEDAGGVAVLAHPGLSGIDELIPLLAEAGLAGLEAYHGAHDEGERERYARLAEDLGLVATGGSDFHGEHREGQGIGTADVPPSVTAALQAAHVARRMRV